MKYFWSHRKELSYSLNEFYISIGTTKQAFHQHLKRSIRYKAEVTDLTRIIIQVRNNHPTMNCKDMYYKINPLFVGRDRFESICRAYGFTIEKRKNYRRTTDSSGVVKFENLTKNIVTTWIDQIWSSDITYFEIEKVFYYITFIMDNHSRRILGHMVSSRLSTEHTSMPALRRAIKTRGESTLPKGIIFHSDGGGQYYDKEFLSMTSYYKFKNSMCDYAWENGKAERINGVIKNNYLDHWEIKTLKQLIKCVDRAVDLYNTDKPHSSLHRKTPLEFEENINTFTRQKRSMVKESFDEKIQILRALSPEESEQKRSQIQDIISEKMIDK